MRVFVVLLGILSVMTQASAQSDLAPSKDAYMRCTAISFLISQGFKNKELKDRFTTEFEAHSKLVVWFYADNPANIIPDTGAVIQSIGADLNAKRLSNQAFMENAEQCSVLLLHTLNKFMNCVGEKGLSEDKRRTCAIQSVGLKE